MDEKPKGKMRIWDYFFELLSNKSLFNSLFVKVDKLPPIPPPMKVTIDQLGKIILPRVHKDSKLIALTKALNDTLEKYEINTKLRVCHFLAQVIHESGGFKYTEEIWGPTKAQKRYEGRSDLGNINKGDGYLFRGRGYIQLTGRENYHRASRSFSISLEKYPDLVAKDPYNMLIAGWYWDTRALNNYADKDSLNDVTIRVNGGLNGLKDRQKWLDKCKEILI